MKKISAFITRFLLLVNCFVQLRKQLGKIGSPTSFFKYITTCSTSQIPFAKFANLPTIAY
ncbi:MAG: hypothetical protein K1X55_17835 [Chitinophagales bacterium]|nr:hypothetical protein [Chitinophagales bacterium]